MRARQLARTVFVEIFLMFKLNFKFTQIAHTLAYNLFTYTDAVASV
jgi:hypothetical protein